MYDILLVHERHCRHQLLEDYACLLLCEGVSLLEPIQQLSTLYQLHHHVDMKLVSEHIHQAHNVRVALTQLQDLDLSTGVVSAGNTLCNDRITNWTQLYPILLDA